ncbi:MAG TPA: DNA gyrase inhibitor YacG [Bradyrhizobium sp.]|nr:DNA gyrase inhibitor YacG [Bradyrhizobium sp.]
MPSEPPKDAGPDQDPSKGPGKPCPICGKPATEASRPFCSERCRDVDLNRWLSNSYAIPGRREADEDED